MDDNVRWSILPAFTSWSVTMLSVAETMGELEKKQRKTDSNGASIRARSSWVIVENIKMIARDSTIKLKRTLSYHELKFEARLNFKVMLISSVERNLGLRKDYL